MRLAISLAALIAACSSALAIDEFSAAPPEVAASVKSTIRGCKGSLVFGDGFAKKQDINADGKPDWIVDYSNFACDNIRLFCGPSGCLTTIFASLPNGRHVKVLDDNVQGISFRRTEKGAAMVLELQGSTCGKVESEHCKIVLHWNGSKFAPAD